MLHLIDIKKERKKKDKGTKGKDFRGGILKVKIFLSNFFFRLLLFLP